ncbi:MAG: biotin--[acetyl-CoA-carboxylase] ligase [Leptospira bouyouniensis]|uniref:biotin--[biotin carboxyl-carrier protein] ligase n=1 Tax=Leptospira bouyouniensis TaxID=2484911 RepID=A0A7I0ISP2_9LEPT|nr:biotin--[acetyl-CoA-carboxylase] ligase [Leptospira bouyouniensis]TGK53154.1 biotin--[acetyl-CoA-carboxylase] ligase [Leptospira bouyouniensis]TGL08209.1 biotin--[acetyl-CoA-carboxylase] ligase [Leptospira bouyouniensis]TGM87372.1 biotin--[acetyl-CoA-carboxylase] ligase [Leptospira bouyouniensis]
MQYRLLKPELGHRLPSVNSTNEWIRNPEIPFGSWVIAEEQTEGKGRGNNIWQSLGEEPLIFSGKLRLSAAEISLPLLSIFVSSALLKTIFAFFPDREEDTTIKWPNDIYKHEKKVAGILVQSEFTNGVYDVVIGIGLNFFGNLIPEPLIDKATYLCESKMGEGELERFVNHLVIEINQAVINLLDPSQVMKDLVWIEAHSLLKNKVIEAEWEERIVRGRVLGIDELGFLLIMTETGQKIELMDTSPKFRMI